MFNDVKLLAADLGSRVFQDVCLRPLGSRDCAFESRWGMVNFLL